MFVTQPTTILIKIGKRPQRKSLIHSFSYFFLYSLSSSASISPVLWKITFLTNALKKPIPYPPNCTILVTTDNPAIRRLRLQINDSRKIAKKYATNGNDAQTQKKDDIISNNEPSTNAAGKR